MKLISVSKYFTYLFLIILILGCNDGTSTYVHPPPSSSDFPYVFDEYPATGIVTEYDEYLIEQNEERWIFIKGKLLVEYNSYIIYVNDEHLGTGSLEELSYNNKNTGNFTKPIKIDASEYDGLVEPPNAKIDVTDYSGEDIYYTHDFTVRYIEPREMNVQYTYLKSHDESNNILTHDILEYLDTPFIIPSTTTLVEEAFSRAGLDLTINTSTPNVVTLDATPDLIDGEPWTDMIDKLQEYYQTINSTTKMIDDKYVELVSVHEWGGGNAPVSLGYTVPFSNTYPNATLCFVSDWLTKNVPFTNWGNDNAKLKKLRAVLITHELGHARGKNNNWLTWNNHTGGHNSGCYQYFDSNNEVDNDYCVMSALDRFGFPINTSDANAFWEIQTTTLNFCQGHIQMLLNISWK